MRKDEAEGRHVLWFDWKPLLENLRIGTTPWDGTLSYCQRSLELRISISSSDGQ